MKIRLNPKWKAAQFEHKVFDENGSEFYCPTPFRWDNEDDALSDFERIQNKLPPLKAIPIYETIP